MHAVVLTSPRVAYKQLTALQTANRSKGPGLHSRNRDPPPALLSVRRAVLLPCCTTPSTNRSLLRVFVASHCADPRLFRRVHLHASRLSSHSARCLGLTCLSHPPPPVSPYPFVDPSPCMPQRSSLCLTESSASFSSSVFRCVRPSPRHFSRAHTRLARQHVRCRSKPSSFVSCCIQSLLRTPCFRLRDSRAVPLSALASVDPFPRKRFRRLADQRPQMQLTAARLSDVARYSLAAKACVAWSPPVCVPCSVASVPKKSGYLSLLRFACRHAVASSRAATRADALDQRSAPARKQAGRCLALRSRDPAAKGLSCERSVRPYG
ncbi:hypothetical protein ERJ75_000116200 [Trypanosoma vivax]|nr:hypothetical protein ERJ75_000116200 [Trypanosoma vivax]